MSAPASSRASTSTTSSLLAAQWRGRSLCPAPVGLASRSAPAPPICPPKGQPPPPPGGGGGLVGGADGDRPGRDGGRDGGRGAVDAQRGQRGDRGHLAGTRAGGERRAQGGPAAVDRAGGAAR